MGRRPKRDMRNIYPYRLADGTEVYQVRVRVNGQRLSQSAKSYREALRIRNRLEEARYSDGEPPVQPKPRGRPVGSGRRTVQGMVRDYLREVRPPDDPSAMTRGRAGGRKGARRYPLAPRTWNTYRGALKNWIHNTRLGRRDPVTVRTQHITEWMEEVEAREKPASEEMIRTGLKLLSGAFAWAVQRDVETGVVSNPVLNAPWPVPRRTVEPEFFDFETTEWIRQWILHASSGSRRQRRRDALYFSIMQGTGMRPGEVRQLLVQHCEGTYIVVPADISKNGQRREVPLWRPTQEEIAAYLKETGLKPGDPLIPRLDGEPMGFGDWERWRKRAFAPARDWTAALTGDTRLLSARAYDVCRHRWARAQLQALMPPQEVARAMGHDLSTLARIYAGPIREQANTVAELRKGGQLYDPERELQRARDKVAAQIAAALEKYGERPPKKRSEGRLTLSEAETQAEGTRAPEAKKGRAPRSRGRAKAGTRK